MDDARDVNKREVNSWVRTME